MNFENNPCIKPLVKEEGFNKIRVLDEKVNQLEKLVSDMSDNIETKELNVTETAHIKNLEVENQSTTYESFSADTFTLNKINEETPILSPKVVGYDENGKLIPIEAQYEGFDLYDYIVDSQEKFDTLITLAKSASGLTFKNVAIIGGYGDGTSGDYIYSPTETTNFNKANIVGYKSAKITVNVDDVATDDLVVFDNVGTVKNVNLSVIGTLSVYNLSVFKGATLEDLTINHTSYNPPYTLDSCTLKNVINNEYITFKDCILGNLDTVQSVFNGCNSNQMYVKQNANENRKFVFTDSAVHVYTKEDNSTIKISEMTNSNIECLDENSKFKMTVECDSSDHNSKIIGHLNDSVGTFDLISMDAMTLTINLTKDNIDFYSGLKRFDFDYPSTVHAFIDLGESTRTIIYTDDLSNPSTMNAYLEYPFTADNQIKKWKSGTDIGYTLGSNTSIYYANLTFNTIIELTNPTNEPFNPLEVSDSITTSGNIKKYLINNNEYKNVCELGEYSHIIIYEDDSDSSNKKFYLGYPFTENNQIRKWKDGYNEIGYTLGSDTSIYYHDLSFNNFGTLTNPNETDFSPILANKFRINENAYNITLKCSPTNEVKVKHCLINIVSNS